MCGSGSTHSATTSPTWRPSRSCRGDIGGSVYVPGGKRRGLHRHAGRRDRLYRESAEGLRRVRRDHGAGAQLGGLGRDEAALRADGALSCIRISSARANCGAAVTPMRAITTTSSSASRVPRCRRRSIGWRRGRRPRSKCCGAQSRSTVGRECEMLHTTLRLPLVAVCDAGSNAIARDLLARSPHELMPCQKPYGVAC